MGVDIVARNEALSALWKYVDQNLPYNIVADDIRFLLTDVWFACDEDVECSTALACDYLGKWGQLFFSLF